jgi:hypothetical protein
VPFPLRSRLIIKCATPAGQTTFVPAGGVFVLPPTGQTATNKAQFSELTITMIAPDIWLVGGDCTGS